MITYIDLRPSFHNRCREIFSNGKKQQKNQSIIKLQLTVIQYFDYDQKQVHWLCFNPNLHMICINKTNNVIKLSCLLQPELKRMRYKKTQQERHLALNSISELSCRFYIRCVWMPRCYFMSYNKRIFTEIILKSCAFMQKFY